MGKKLGKECDQPTLLPTADRARAGALRSRPARVQPSSVLMVHSQDTGSPFPPPVLDTRCPVFHIYQPASSLPCFVVPPFPSERPSLCSAPSPSRSHLNSLVVPGRLSLLKTPFSEPHPGTASSQHILAGGHSGFCWQPHSLVELAHYIVGLT